MLIGIVADTHGLLRPEALAALAGVARILHAGDIGGPEIVPALARVAPVEAIRGNVDRAAWAAAFPETLALTLAGRRVLMVHDAAPLRRRPPEGVELVVAGHSHRVTVAPLGAALLVNPGSIGPRRFGLPATLALLDLGAEPLAPEIVTIEG